MLLHGVQSSQNTWWRQRMDLTDLGWEVRAVDLLGHGDRAATGGQILDVAALAEDVVQQIGGPVDLLVGHSLGAVVGLTLLDRHPHFCRAIVLEDPPALNASLDPRHVATEVRAAVTAARTDPDTVIAELLADHPGWAPIDAQNVLTNLHRLDELRVTGLLDAADWDLGRLVSDSPVPVGLLAAGTDSALLDPDRSAILTSLPADHRVVIDSGHGIHRDRPSLWLHHVLEFAARWSLVDASTSEG